MFRAIIEIGFSLGLFANVLLFIPQIIKLYKVKNPQGLSLLTFGGFNLIQLFTVLHGYLAKDYLLFWGYLFSMVTCGTVTVMICWYRIKNRNANVINPDKTVKESANLTDSLQVLQEQLANTKRQKIEFIHNVEDDLRDPVSGIAQMSKILAAGEQNPTTKEALETITHAAEQLLQLIDDIPSFSDLADSHLPLAVKKFDLRDIIQKIIDLQAPMVRLRKLRLIVECSPDVPATIISDETRIYRILLNLVNNAVKFTNQGYIKIIAEVAQQTDQKNMLLKLIVKDTGIGIPKEKQSIMRRLPSTQRPIDTSVGLSIVKQFMQDLGGEINLESDMNEGSTFTCLIPVQLPWLAEQATPVTTQPTAKTNWEIAAKHTQAIKILLIEDDIFAQAFSKALLNQCFPNVQLDFATNGKAAVDRAVKNNHDLILLDLGLPDMSGFELAKKIRGLINTKVPIIALTAHGFARVNDDCVKAGINDVITKPLIPERVHAVICKWLNLQPELMCNVPLAATSAADLQNKVIDWDFVMQFVGDKQQAHNLIDEFIKELTTAQQEIKTYIAAKDLDAIAAITHKMIGGAAYCGAARLKSAATNLNNAARNHHQEEISALFDQLKIAIDELADNYEQEIKK